MKVKTNMIIECVKSWKIKLSKCHLWEQKHESHVFEIK